MLFADIERTYGEEDEEQESTAAWKWGESVGGQDVVALQRNSVWSCSSKVRIEVLKIFEGPAWAKRCAFQQIKLPIQWFTKENF